LQFPSTAAQTSFIGPDDFFYQEPGVIYTGLPPDPTIQLRIDPMKSRKFQFAADRPDIDKKKKMELVYCWSERDRQPVETAISASPSWLIAKYEIEHACKFIELGILSLEKRTYPPA
jgi:hypothetical protein